MPTHSSAKDSASHATQPFFASQVPPAASFFPNPAAAEFVQRKCDACDGERQLQPQLEAGAVDDPLEFAADAMADRVVRRRAIDAVDRRRVDRVGRRAGVGHLAGRAGGEGRDADGEAGRRQPAAPALPVLVGGSGDPHAAPPR